MITGAAGFIGFHLSKRLLELGYRIIGLDNLNSYYDIKLKYNRLKILEKFSEFTFIEMDLIDSKSLNDIFGQYQPEIVINLAAQAGVRYSIENPKAYIDSNIIGFFNVMLDTI